MNEVAIAGITGFSILGAVAVGLIYNIFGADSESVHHSKVAQQKALMLNAELNADTGSGRRSRKVRRSRRSGRSKKSRRN